MKAIKLKKSDYKSFESVIRASGAIADNQAYPSFVFMNRKDFKKVLKAVKAAIKKARPLLRSNKINLAAHMEALNLGPVISDAVADGYVIVDTAALKSALDE